jgi:UDP-3-O-acyl N-acetylglucosamine deacetylase
MEPEVLESMGQSWNEPNVLIQSVRQQRTLRTPVRLAGIGYWSSKDVIVEFRPALPGTGITFVRCDYSPVRRIRARIENRIETPRRTTLRKHGLSVVMVEHILAALAGLQIDNCEVWVNSEEMPAWDGSSHEAVAALTLAGYAEQELLRERFVIREPIRIGSDQAWIQTEPDPENGCVLSYELDFGASASIPRQALMLHLTPQSFMQEIASARTFITESEARRMQANGLGARITYKDLLVFGPDGPIQNELRYPDECARHKLLDMVGDLSLLEADVCGRISAYRSGHQLNAEFVQLLRKSRIARGGRMSA